MDKCIVNIDVSMQNIDIKDIHGILVSGCTLQAEGSTLREIFNSTTISLVDQDGSEICRVCPWDLDCFEDVEDLLIEKYRSWSRANNK